MVVLNSLALWLRPEDSLVFGSKFVSIVASTPRPGILRVEATIMAVFVSGTVPCVNTPNITGTDPDSTQRTVCTTYKVK